MTARTARLLLIPALAGLAAATLAYVLTERTRAPVQEGVPVLVARSGIPAGTPLAPDMFDVRQAPKDLAAGAVGGPAGVAGRIARTDILPGEIIRPGRLADPGRDGLAYRIPEGMRAITVAVNETSGAGGYPLPGDRVDLILVLRQQGPRDAGRDAVQSRILLQDILVLAKGPAQAAKGSAGGTGGDTGRLTSYTLAVTPAQAAEVALAEEVGHVRLVLRPAAERGTVPPVILDSTRYGQGGQPEWTGPSRS